LAHATFRRYEYRRRLPHYQRDDCPLFVTFRTLKPLQLTPEARNLALQHCLHDHGRSIRLHAAVVMPDHVHLLFTALRDAEGWTFALPEILKAIKGCSARSINVLLGRTGSVWQDESFDHVLRGAESLQETIEYIRQNPARKGLVSRPEDYLWLWVEQCAAGNSCPRTLTTNKNLQNQVSLFRGKVLCSWLDPAGRSARATFTPRPRPSAG
jgi:putative transposase